MVQIRWNRRTLIVFLEDLRDEDLALICRLASRARLDPQAPTALDYRPNIVRKRLMEESTVA
jgi:hypothetical protein